MLTLTLTVALTLLTLIVTVIGDTNPTTNYWYEFDNLNCIFAYEEFVLCLVNVCIRCFILH